MDIYFGTVDISTSKKNIYFATLDISSLNKISTLALWTSRLQRRYLLCHSWNLLGDGHTGKGDMFFEEETSAVAKEISSLKRRWPHWQRRYLLWRGNGHSGKGDIFFEE
jgi:hypothetical protein